MSKNLAVAADWSANAAHAKVVRRKTELSAIQTPCAQPMASRRAVGLHSVANCCHLPTQQKRLLNAVRSDFGYLSAGRENMTMLGASGLLQTLPQRTVQALA